MSTSYYWNTFCPTKFGTGASQSIGEDAKKLGFTRVMVCTEKALMDFGIATQVVAALEKAGLTVLVYDKCVADAPSRICDEGVVFARENKVDGIVAVGGGSTIDTGKAIGLVISMDGTTIADYYHSPEPAHKSNSDIYPLGAYLDKSTLLTRQCSPKKRDNASRVFSLGFVMGGAPFCS